MRPSLAAFLVLASALPQATHAAPSGFVTFAPPHLQHRRVFNLDGAGGGDLVTAWETVVCVANCDGPVRSRDGDARQMGPEVRWGTVLWRSGVVDEQRDLASARRSYSAYRLFALGDVDGDGRSDLVTEYDRGSTRAWAVYTSTGSGLTGGGDWTETTTAGVTLAGIGDADGDGKDDLWVQFDSGGTRHWQLRRSRGTDFGAISSWSTTTTSGVEVVGVGDANGDGKDDLWLQFDGGGKRHWQVRLSSGATASTTMPVTSTTTPGLNVVGVADANGDGKDDLWLQYDHNGSRQWQVRLSTGSGFGATYNTTTTTPGVEVIGVDDANGDGKADLWLQYDSGGQRHWQVRPSTGTAFGATFQTSTSTSGVSAVQVADADGDRKADLWLTWTSQREVPGPRTSTQTLTERHVQVRGSSGTAFPSAAIVTRTMP